MRPISDFGLRTSDLRRLRRGMTVLELVIAMGLMTIVVAVMAPILHGVQSSWAAKEGNCESMANVLAFLHHFRQHVSQASCVTAVSDSATAKGYIQFVASDGNEVRYDVDGGDDIQFGPLGEPADLAGPADVLRFTCYDANGLGVPITDGNSIRLITVDLTIRNPNASGHSQTARTSVYLRADPAPQEQDDIIVDPGVAMKDQIDWAHSTAVIDSYRSSQGAYNPGSPGSEAPVSVNASGSNEIVLSNSATIRGDAYVGPDGDPDTGISVTGGAQITGARKAMTEAVDIPYLSAPTGWPFDGSSHTDYTLSGYSLDLISSNRHYKKMRLRNHSTLLIWGNVTILANNKFDMEDDARILILPGSSLKLYVKHDVTITEDARANCPYSIWLFFWITVTNPDPEALRLYMIGNNKTLTMDSSAQMWAVAQNPDGDVEISGDAEFFGKMKANELDDGSANNGGKIHVDLDAQFD